LNDQPAGSAQPVLPETKPQKDDLFPIGLVLTIAWLAAGIPAMLFLSDRSAWPKPNEWGDIFAGLFAPVAFLWLVLGFRQQGRELQLSTRALELQVAELKQSVEQQKELVGVTKQQFLANIDEQERRRIADIQATKPRFSLYQSGSMSGGARGTIIYHFTLRNEGATATNLLLKVFPASSRDTAVRFETFKRGSSLEYPNLPASLSVEIDYDDLDGIPDTA
jgi:hypothetical protein